MIKPALKNQAFLDDVRKAKLDTSGFHLWWLGQSGFLVQWQNNHLLIDPYLSDSLTKKYANTEKPHIRMTELVIEPHRLDFIDIVSSSHNHTDHLDGETLIPIVQANPHIQMVIPRANREFVAQRTGKEIDWPVCLNEGESVSFPSGIVVHGIPAAHNELKKDEEGNCCYMGYVFQLGNYSIYHSGDTLWHESIIRALEIFNIDVAILPVNGNKPARRVAGNLNADEAVRMAKSIEATVLIPCHYHMFTFNSVDPDEFNAFAEKEKQEYIVLNGGERYSYRKLNSNPPSTLTQ